MAIEPLVRCVRQRARSGAIRAFGMFAIVSAIGAAVATGMIETHGR
jgi:hypothetical protein